MNGFTDAPSIKPDHATWNVTWTVLIQIRSFSGRFIFLHLSTSPRSDFPGSHGVKKTLTNLFCFKRAHYKVLIFFMFSFMAYGNLAMSPKRLESELTNVTRWHLFFILSIPLFTFSCPNFSVICLFWQTLTAHDDTRTRQHLRQGRKYFTPKWRHLMLFFAGETSRAFALMLAFAAENIRKYTTRTLCSWKNLSSTCREV